MGRMTGIVEVGKWEPVKLEGGGGRTSWERGLTPKTVIAKLRYDCKMTQGEFARAVGICNLSQVSHYESGKTRPRIDTARKVIAFARERGIEMTLEQLYE